MRAKSIVLMTSTLCSRNGSWAGVLKEEPLGLLQSAASVEQDIVFARDLDAHAEVVVLLQVVDDHVGEVMHVDDHFPDSEGGEAAKGNFQQRVSGDFHQGLGTIVGQGPQAGTESRGEDHGLHVAAFSAAEFSAFILSSSRWVTTTSTPLRPRRRLATCSARYTERCWPPVQPKETIRFLNPRCW